MHLRDLEALPERHNQGTKIAGIKELAMREVEIRELIDAVVVLGLKLAEEQHVGFEAVLLCLQLEAQSFP